MFDDIFFSYTIFCSKMTRPGIRPIPAEIEYNNMRFLITEQPQVGQWPASAYLNETQLQNVIFFLDECLSESCLTSHCNSS